MLGFESETQKIFLLISDITPLVTARTTGRDWTGQTRNIELDFHSPRANVVSVSMVDLNILFCVRIAEEGGVSRRINFIHQLRLIMRSI